jgi:predicted ester cyclase
MITQTTDQVRAFMDEYFAAIAVEKSPETVAKFVSSEALKEHIATFEAAFPGYQLEVHDLVVQEGEPSKVAVDMTVHGTYNGSWGIGVAGSEVSLHAIYLYEVAGGKIVGFQGQADTAKLYEQISMKLVPV